MPLRWRFLPVLFTLLLLTRSAVSHRPALRLRGGGSPSITSTAAAVEEVQPRLPAAAVRGEAASLQPSHTPPPRWPAGSGLVVALLYLVALVNGLARRTLSCAAPGLTRDRLFTKAELEGVYMGGYQSFALGRALAALIISRLGSKRALLLQLAVLCLSCSGFCASAGRPKLQASTRPLVNSPNARRAPSSSRAHPCPSLSFAPARTPLALLPGGMLGDGAPILGHDPLGHATTRPPVGPLPQPTPPPAHTTPT